VAQPVLPTPNRQASTRDARNPHQASQEPKSLDAVLGALATRNIEARFDRISKVVFAQSYKDKDFLKALGFRWDARTRHWLLQAA
jgi:hypothetical protein